MSKKLFVSFLCLSAVGCPADASNETALRIVQLRMEGTGKAPVKNLPVLASSSAKMAVAMPAPSIKPASFTPPPAPVPAPDRGMSPGEGAILGIVIATIGMGAGLAALGWTGALIGLGIGALFGFLIFSSSLNN